MVFFFGQFFFKWRRGVLGIFERTILFQSSSFSLETLYAVSGKFFHCEQKERKNMVFLIAPFFMMSSVQLIILFSNCIK